MLFTITGKHIEITDAIRSRVEDKTAKLPRYYNSLNQVEVIIEGSDGGNPSVEIIARAEHGKVFVARDVGEDMYACIDAAAHKIERQIRRKKERERNNKHIPGAGEKEIAVSGTDEEE